MRNALDDEPSDARLLEAVRAGDLDAFGVLFRRHAERLHRAALRYGAEPAEQQDLVAETFTRVLMAINRGEGPRDNLRPYLFVTIRNLVINWRHRHSRIDPYREMSEIDQITRRTARPGSDEIVERRWNSDLAWSAFHTLPQRWQAVLWQTEVNGASPAELAPLLGLSPNGVAALAVRAREGLRRAYLQAQIPETPIPRCRKIRQRMGAWLRGYLSARAAAPLTTHLTGCPACHEVATNLAEANRELPVFPPRSG